MKKILAMVVIGFMFVATLGFASVSANGAGDPFDDLPSGPFPADVQL
jgi:hypothetical protein